MEGRWLMRRGAKAAAVTPPRAPGLPSRATLSHNTSHTHVIRRPNVVMRTCTSLQHADTPTASLHEM